MDVVLTVLFVSFRGYAALHPRVIAHKDWTVQAAYCDRMAGLRETCTHVAALLFAIKANVWTREVKTVTQEKAYWMLPSYSPIANIDSTTRAKQLIQLVENSVICNKRKPQKHLVPPTQSKADDFFQNWMLLVLSLWYRYFHVPVHIMTNLFHCLWKVYFLNLLPLSMMSLAQIWSIRVYWKSVTISAYH